jgi:hypothetical protein
MEGHIKKGSKLIVADSPLTAMVVRKPQGFASTAADWL